MPTSENERIVRRTIDEVWNRGKFSAVPEHFASDFVGHVPDRVEGQEGVKRFVAAMRRAAQSIQIEDLIADGDKVAARWTAQGRHEGELNGIPATGRHVIVNGITIFRIANGKVVEGWTMADRLGLMQQIGAIPAPEKAWFASP